MTKCLFCHMLRKTKPFFGWLEELGVGSLQYSCCDFCQRWPEVPFKERATKYEKLSGAKMKMHLFSFLFAVGEFSSRLKRFVPGIGCMYSPPPWGICLHVNSIYFPQPVVRVFVWVELFWQVTHACGILYSGRACNSSMRTRWLAV